MEVDLHSQEVPQETPLVSIIIPTYNRAHLICETLDSILAQTYPNWECIIVDDGSTDDTDAVVGKYVDKDVRFRYYHRPADRPKGANACRNYGFEKSKGAFVNWFDSDDLMVDRKLEVQLNKLLTDNLDFTVSKYVNFKSESEIFEEIAFNRNYNKDLNADNFIKYKVYWATSDLLCSRGLASTYKYNETLKSSQEFHFFIGLLLTKPKGKYIDAVLTLKRFSSVSIQVDQSKDHVLKSKNLILTYSSVLNDYDDLLSIQSKQFLAKKLMLYCTFLSYHLKKNRIIFLNNNLNKKIFGLKKYISIIIFLYIIKLTNNYHLISEGRIKRLYFKL
ncbi:glycosyltransferase family 2 protein [Flavobacterium orientale]|uniref:Beta-1,3-N-acetylglucosaminyltransferase n=1 Tax=Flavobacterium orientale TaxID=1756020 RepID=A0A916XWC7_9FLAO|nr:glycosyltransferase family 2 protein [Flavobacterium orientale]GGD14944.1 beta-1,3-N-acetylglucosaminyltransferase [Flavobacterium orientale]